MTVKEFIIDGIVSYYAGNGVEWASEEARAIMAESKEEWEGLKYAKNQDDFLDDVATEINDLDKPFSHDYELVYEGDKTDGNYTEYNGTIINAADLKMAYEIMNGMAGEYGIPDTSDYSFKEV